MREWIVVVTGGPLLIWHWTTVGRYWRGEERQAWSENVDRVLPRLGGSWKHAFERGAIEASIPLTLGYLWVVVRLVDSDSGRLLLLERLLFGLTIAGMVLSTSVFLFNVPRALLPPWARAAPSLVDELLAAPERDHDSGTAE